MAQRLAAPPTCLIKGLPHSGPASCVRPAGPPRAVFPFSLEFSTLALTRAVTRGDMAQDWQHLPVITPRCSGWQWLWTGRL